MNLDFDNPDFFIQGIEKFLAKNRCSLSVDETILLQSCCDHFKQLKQEEGATVRNEILDFITRNFVKLMMKPEVINLFFDLFNKSNL
jgi:hypothetical protein